MLHLLEYELNHVRYWLITPISFMPPLPQHIFQTVHNLRSKILWLGWCLYYTFSSVQSTFPHQKVQDIGVKVLRRYQFNFTMFNQLYSCLQKCGLAVSLWRTNYSLGNSLGCLGISVLPLGLTTRLTVTQTWYCQFHLVTINSQWGFVSSFICQFKFHHLLMYTFYKTSAVPPEWP